MPKKKSLQKHDLNEYIIYFGLLFKYAVPDVQNIHDIVRLWDSNIGIHFGAAFRLELK